ncbi:MAG: DNA repair protein RecO [Candidatus Yanofskybacteria bacterium]|nr:DNA repair protein RecO [Candidatus Yanofskybacteria bacterium]
MRTQAIILKKIPIREYDALVICYIKDSGKQIYQAKGILQPTSKQAGHLDILNLVDFSLVHKNSHPIITSAYCLKAFPHLKSSLSAMAAAFFLLECFDKLVFEGESDPKLWDFLLTRLEIYNGQSLLAIDWPKLIAETRQEILKTLGYDPSVPIEYVANAQFKSSQFARKVLE